MFVAQYVTATSRICICSNKFYLHSKVKSGVKSTAFTIDRSHCAIDYCCWFYQFTHMYVWNARKTLSCSQSAPKMALQFFRLSQKLWDKNPLEMKRESIIYSLRYHLNVCVENLSHASSTSCVHLSRNIGSLADINWWYKKMESIGKWTQCLP